MSDIVLRVAAKGVILNEKDQVLIVREANTYEEGTNIGKWGIPGGRIELGEAFYDGLAREMREEVGLEVEPLQPIFIGEWRPVIKDVPHQIVALFVACRAVSKGVILSDEHDAFAWVDQETMHEYPFMAPDNEVLRQCFKTVGGGNG